MVIHRVEDDWPVTEMEVALDVNFDVNVRYITDKTDTRKQVMDHELYLGKFGRVAITVGSVDFYVVRSTIKWAGQDANVAWWDSVISCSSVRPTQNWERLENPLNRPVRLSKVVQGREAVSSVIDYRGRAVCNSAGDYFGGFEVEVPTKKFVYAGNYSSIPEWMFHLDGTVNSEPLVIKTRRVPNGSPLNSVVETTITTIPIGCGKLVIEDVPLEPSYESGVAFYPINYEIHYKPDGWQSLLMNRGFHEYVYLDKFGTKVSPRATPGDLTGQLYERKKVACLDDAGETVKQPVFIDSFGRKMLKPKMRTERIGQATTFLNSNLVTALGFGLTEDDIGTALVFKGFFSWGYPVFSTEVKSIGTTPQDIITVDPIPFSSGASLTPSDVFLPGIAGISFARCPFADWGAAGVQI